MSDRLARRAQSADSKRGRAVEGRSAGSTPTEELLRGITALRAGIAAILHDDPQSASVAESQYECGLSGRSDSRCATPDIRRSESYTTWRQAKREAFGTAAPAHVDRTTRNIPTGERLYDLAVKGRQLKDMWAEESRRFSEARPTSPTATGPPSSRGSGYSVKSRMMAERAKEQHPSHPDLLNMSLKMEGAQSQIRQLRAALCEAVLKVESQERLLDEYRASVSPVQMERARPTARTHRSVPNSRSTPTTSPLPPMEEHFLFHSASHHFPQHGPHDRKSADTQTIFEPSDILPDKVRQMDQPPPTARAPAGHAAKRQPRAPSDLHSSVSSNGHTQHFEESTSTGELGVEQRAAQMAQRQLSGRQKDIDRFAHLWKSYIA